MSSITECSSCTNNKSELDILISKNQNLGKCLDNLREENKEQHLTICSLISKNQNLGKYYKHVRQQLVVVKKKHLCFKINQTKKYNTLLQVNHKVLSEHRNLKKSLKNLSNQNKTLQESLDNVLNVELEGVKKTALCDDINFNVDELIEIEEEINEMEIPNDVESHSENTESSIPSTPPESSVVDESMTIENDHSDNLTPKKNVSKSKKRKRTNNTVQVRKSNRVRNSKKKK